MCIDRKSFTFCKCIHITELIYIVYVTTAITHTVPILFLLFYAQWLALIAAAIIAIAHIFFAVAIHKESYRLLVIFIVYQCGAVIALIALDIWALIIMEMFPGTSIFAENCRKTNPTNYNECVRLKAAILGGVTLADTIINLAFVAPVLKSYFLFLRESPISPSSTAKISRFSAPGIGDAALDRERYFGSVDVPYFRKFSANPQQGPFRAQPFTVYAPLRDPLALGDTGLPQQYANPTTGNSAYANPAGTLYQQQNPLFVSRMPDDKELTAQQSYLPVFVQKVVQLLNDILDTIQYSIGKPRRILTFCKRDLVDVIENIREILTNHIGLLVIREVSEDPDIVERMNPHR
ncbi:hypothetical protein RB195_004245 [Necator americanus]|uniref:Uncharacterized protein n=1 Tax=Necator americanus TaxID=51031 RepID=A0ABR1BL09_NECAM